MINEMSAGEMEEDIKHNRVGGLIQLENYQGSDLNMTGWDLEAVLDDILMVEFADATEDNQNVNRGGILLPTGASKNVWRVGKVVLAGPNTRVKVGQYVMFPNDKGIQAKNINGKKHVVFLNEQRIFGIVKPSAK
jgi:co-chaperonin GroES (HSP10)